MRKTKGDFEFKILSHACMLVRSGKHSVIIDPWLIGSCYWRSWWNYPEPIVCEDELRGVDAVILSHIHWDHWHGPTLKKYFKNKPVVIGDDPNFRSRRDLHALGFKDLRVVRHEETLKLGDINITFYNFGSFLNDSAIVIEVDGISILNANDAKIAGSSLRRIVRRHGPFEFALRSHSSANSRACYSVAGEAPYNRDDREHYFRSFMLFMDAVKPLYAVPFASNHCHLNPDVFQFNRFISNPFELSKFLESTSTNREAWEFVQMQPGSSWSKDAGFTLENTDSFDDYISKIEKYQERKRSRLNFYDSKEQAVQITEALLARFVLMSRGLWSRLRSQQIRFVLTRSVNESVAFVLKRGKTHHSLDISEEPRNSEPVVIMPAIVFKDAVMKNMFHHAGISKRCRYLAANERDMRMLQKFIADLERKELVDNTPFFWVRLIQRQARRWRDVHAYALAVYYRYVLRYPIFLVEEKILSRHS